MSSLALVLALSAAVAHAAWNVIAHGSSRGGLPFLWWGAVCASVLWAGVVPFTGGIGGGDIAGFALGVAVSAVLHVLYMVVLQRGYAAGDLSTVYATARGTGPLLTVIVALTVFGEQLSPFALVGVVLVIGGVVAIAVVDRRSSRSQTSAPHRPPRRGLDPAIGFGLLTGVGIAAYTLWDTFALRQFDLAPVAFMVGCTALEVVILTVMLFRGGQHRALAPMWRLQWRRLVAFGVLSPLSYILVLTAVKIAPVALVAPVREVSVVLVSLFGAFVLRETHPARRVGASVLVVAGIVLLAF